MRLQTGAGWFIYRGVGGPIDRGGGYNYGIIGIVSLTYPCPALWVARTENTHRSVTRSIMPLNLGLYNNVDPVKWISLCKFWSD